MNGGNNNESSKYHVTIEPGENYCINSLIVSHAQSSQKYQSVSNVNFLNSFTYVL